QNLMESNRPELLRSGVWYPEVGLYWQGPRPEKQAGHSRFNDAAVGGGSDLRRHLQAGARILGDRLHTIILSSEAFFLHEKSHRIPGYLSDFDCEAVIYLRRQDEWANSQYCELVAGGAVDRVWVPIGDWLRHDEVRAWMDYRYTLDRFANALPKEKITVRVFDPLEMKSGDLVEDFADAAGVPELLDLERPEKSHSNVAIFNSAQIEKLRTLNACSFKGRDGYREFIDEVGRGITAWQRSHGHQQVPPMMLTKEDRRKLLEDNRAANEEIARNWLGKQDGHLFNTEMTGDYAMPPPLHSEEIAIINKSFMRWAKKASAPDVALQPTNSDTLGAAHSSRIVNYGLFGWRLWALTPLVRMQVKLRGTRVDLVAFDRDPAGFFAALESPSFRVWKKWLYPDKSPLGPGRIFAVWVAPLAWVLARLRGETVANRFCADPVLFMRKIENPLLRAAGRLIFPMGEAVADESMH
ncbi:MAG: glycosyltransferase, partial [Boseongicola sp.]